MISLARSTVELFANRRRVCREFVAVAPLRFLIDVLVGFGKSVLELFVFILPIKIVLILAAPEMPVMFDRVLPGISRPEWAGILTGLIVVLHIVVLIADWYLKESAEKYTEKFAVEHKKGRFTDSDFLTSVYSGIVDSRAGTLLLIAISTVIGLVYAQFLFFFVLAVTVSTFGVIGLASVSRRVRDSFLARPPVVLGKVSNLVFISCFCYLVYAFILSDQPPAFLQALVSIILSRRLLGAVSQKVGNLVWFSKKKAAIQKLFYRGHTSIPQGAAGARAFIDYVSREGISTYASRALGDLGFDLASGLECEWVESPFGWMSLVQCVIPDVEGSGSKTVILKVYEANKSRAAKNELELYPELETHGIIPPFIGVTDLAGFQVHAFELSMNWVFTREQERIVGLRQRLLPLTFDQALVEEYYSVHPTLMDRLTPTLLSRLYLVAGAGEKERLDEFIGMLPMMETEIRRLPLKVLPPDPALKQLAVIDGDGDRLLGLGDWRMEPVGFSLWSSDALHELVGQLISAEQALHDSEPEFVESLVKLCSLFAELERHCKSGRLRAGIKVVDSIMEMCADIKSVERGQAVTA